MRNFAPVSGGPSGRLRFAAWYFAFVGVSTLLLLILALVTVARGDARVRQALIAHPMGLLIRSATALLLLGTSYLLYQKSRLGGMFAIILFLPPIIGRVLGEPVSKLGLAIAIVGMIIMLSVWRELNNEPYIGHK